MLFHIKNLIQSEKRRLPLALVIPRRITSLKIRHRTPCERAVLCTSSDARCKASMTVEAAVIIPLFLMAMFTLIFVIDLCRIHVIKQVELREKAEKLGTYAYLSGEYIQDPYIDLQEVYSYKLPVSLIPGYAIDVALRGRVHAWIGRTDAECESDQKTTGETMVYITDHQSVYHTNEACTYLELSVYAVSKADIDGARNQSGERYEVCEKCRGSLEGSIYYITDHGDRFHSTRSCPGLTRNVRLVPLSDTSGLICCSRCKGGS